MPRPKTILSSEYPYHVYARTNNGEKFPIPLEEVWDVYVFLLKKLKNDFEFRIHALTLMPNHFHIACSTPNANLNVCMQEFMFKSTLNINKRAGKINRLYGGRYKWTLVTDPIYFSCLFRYIYQNPLRSHLVGDVFEYPFSSLNRNKELISRNLNFSNLIPQETNVLFNWLNTLPSGEFSKNMRFALSKKYFKFPNKSGNFKETGESFL